MIEPLAKRARIRAFFDDRPLVLHATRNRQTFMSQLPDEWLHGRKVTVFHDETPILGSPVIITSLARTEGFVDSSEGDLHGWAWHPNNLDCDPVLTIVPLDGGAGMTIVATDLDITIAHTIPLAPPRGFRAPAEKLLRFNGPVRIHGPDGRNLTGSPLDPSADRRNAVAASRVVASLFPSPGPRISVQAGDLLFPAVPAHFAGGPVEGGRKKRPVDVIVPVYGGLELTLACLDSVLKDLPRWARVVVVDDASPDPRILIELKKLAARSQVILLPQKINRGFPGTANVGMRHDPTRDVVLLNSDTLVPPGWLQRLRDAAYADRAIGSATPLSNDATILSYPDVEHTNKIPDLNETIHLDELARTANAGTLVDIPTAVGFCVYIKRDCLNATGLLREDIFAQGYCEENDFCIRARHLGWRHVAVPGIFVAHVGGQSFGAAKQFLIERNIRKLNRLHPGYDTLIQEFRGGDPLAEARRRLDTARWKTYRTGEPSVLLVTHGRGGGVQRHVAERARALRAEGLRPIVLWPVASRDGKGRDCVLGNGPEGGTPNLRFTIPDEMNALVRLLKADKPVRAEVHHLVGHDHRLMDLFRILNIPYEVVIHDYSWLCPRINLVGPSKHYCGEPDVAECEMCVADVGTTNDEDTTPAMLRERSAAELTGASRVVVPSEDVAGRIRRHFPSVTPMVTSWENDLELMRVRPIIPRVNGVRRVCVVGAIGIEKGFEILLACARDAARRDLGLHFHLVGYSCDDARLLATGKVTMTGRYEEHQATALVKQQQAYFAWLPSVWPETWCYTLSVAWQAGLNVVAFDIGAPAERIRRTGRGWLFPLGIAPHALNDRMLGLVARMPQEGRGRFRAR